MDPRLLDQHLRNAIAKIQLGMENVKTDFDDLKPMLDAVKHIQAARSELWQDKPELEGAAR